MDVEACGGLSAQLLVAPAGSNRLLYRETNGARLDFHRAFAMEWDLRPEVHEIS